MFFLDYFIPADVYYGLVRQRTGADGNSYPYSIGNGEFVDVLKDQTVVFHRKLETVFERTDGPGSWISTTYFETGIFHPYCETFERYWLELDPRLLRNIFDVYDAEITLERIRYDAYEEDFSMEPHPELFYSKYLWSLQLTIDQPCLPPLECKKTDIDQCLGLC